jgi:hypothetical protein
MSILCRWGRRVAAPWWPITRVDVGPSRVDVESSLCSGPWLISDLLPCFFRFRDQRSGLRHLVYRSLDIHSSNLSMTMLSLRAFPGSNDAAHGQSIITVATYPCRCHPYCWPSSSHWLLIRVKPIAATSVDFVANVTDGSHMSAH